MRGSRWPLALGMVGLGTTAFLLRALSAFQPSPDEPLWLTRSERYIHAYLSFDLPAASPIVEGPGTMPGVTTSLVGGLAHVIWESLQRLGVLDHGRPWFDSFSGLSIAQVGMAAGNALLVVALFWVLRRWSGTVVATTAAVLLATEPYVVAHGARLTTDSFVMLFSAVGAFALLAALGVATTRELDDRQARRMAAVAGLGLGGAVLSKLSAFTMAPFLFAVLVFAGVVAWRAGTLREYWRRVAIVAAAGIAVVVVLWPALWTDPTGQFEVLSRSADQVGRGSSLYFLGEIRGNPGPLFYFVTTPFRMTPWMLVLTVVGGTIAVIVRSTRFRALVMLGYAFVPWWVITAAPKKFDRYTLLVWPAFAVLAGLLAELAFARARWGKTQRERRSVAVGAVTFTVVASLLVAPNGVVYSNPLLGGSEVVQDVVILGGSVRDAGLAIEEREGARCSKRRILSNRARRIYFPCGVLKASHQVDLLEPGDYVVINTITRARDPEGARELEMLGRHVERVTVRGIDIADIYQVTRER